jgi:hypothetical protein
MVLRADLIPKSTKEKKIDVKVAKTKTIIVVRITSLRVGQTIFVTSALTC